MEGRPRLLLFLLAAATCYHGNGAQKTVCTQEAVADIVFMVDGSWSIGTANFQQIRQFLYTLVNSFDVGPEKVRIGLVQYSTTPRTEFLLNTHQNKELILDHISALPYMGGGTHTGQGLDFMMRKHFVAAAGSRTSQQVPQIAVVITDGKSQDNVEAHAQELKSKGIVLYAIGIKDADEDQLREIANEPHSQHVYSVSDFAALQGISQNIVQTLCTTVEEAKRQLLQLSKECAKANVADIVFLVDGSSSIGLSNFKEAKRFLSSVVTGLDIGPDKVRVGLAQYSDKPHQEFLLKDHMDKQSLLAEIGKVRYRTGGTETGEALNFLITTFFTQEAGSRASQRVPQIAVIITDGESTDDVVVPARRLRQKGVIVFAIGVGEAKIQELQSMASRPQERFLFTIGSYQALVALTEGLLQTVCVSMEDQRQALAERFSDIFFLVDSGVTQGEFQQIRTILMRLVNQLNIGASAHRLGLAQYGVDTKVEFLLNGFKTKEQTQAGVKGFRQRRLQTNEQRLLGEALLQASSVWFSSEAGGRAEQGSRQYLVVLSGKNSDDPVDKHARLIKSTGVTVVGMSLGASQAEMRLISSAPHFYDSIANAVPSLKAIFEKEAQEVTLTGDCKAAKVADIVFIVDESGSIGTANFQLVRNFLHSLVSGLEVSPTKVRVGIVLYNERPAVQVYLDSFDNKQELLNFIKILPYRGGSTSTGAALNFTLKNVFTEARGSRKEKGVQQVAVVITDGNSQDNVSQPAYGLRRSGVTVYSVGVKNAFEKELVMMASHPPSKHVFAVDNFVKLKSLEQSLQKAVCANILNQAFTVETRRTGLKEGCVQKDEADIFFLIDHSGSIYPTDFQDMKKFIIEFLRTFRIGPQQIRVGVAKYADEPNMEFDLDVHTDAQMLEKAVEKIKQVGGGTETGRALDFMRPHFDRAMVSRGHKVPEYLVVITDGKSADKVKVPAEKLRAQGVTIYAIGVKSADQTELREISGDPKRTFFVNNFDALTPIKDDIITDICSPEACKHRSGDLLFLIDSSGSIEPVDYIKMKDFMKSVISKSAVAQNDVHVGVMQFGSIQQLEFPLNRLYSKAEMTQAIDAMQQIGGGTLTGTAIADLERYFDAANGGRPKLTQQLVVITDGESQDEVRVPAAALRAKGVLIYAVGVVDANTTQLLEISGSPDKVYAERDFDTLKDLENPLALQLCDQGSECKNTERADIIFLVDGSTTITLPRFKTMLKFMESIVNKTTVGKDLTRFGVILYANKSECVFPLKKHGSKREVLQAIDALKYPTGNTYTGQALQYTLPFFSEEHGGRKAQQVPQFLMVITDGEATDPHNLVAPSVALKNGGVSVFSIGVEGANKKELEIMAGDDPSRIFYVDNFDALETLHKNISQGLCNVTKSVCEKQKADLVFLIDQSDSIAPEDYAIMKNFTTNIVNSFNVSEDLVRVGVAQFNSTFQPEFHLNKFYSLKDVTKHIQNMVKLGGRTNIGLALYSVRDFFEASRGSRRSAGVSQNLILITDGESHDDVADAAFRLRQLGVEIFAIRVGNSHDMELLQITGTTKRLFTVQDFASLEVIRPKVVETICKITTVRSSCSIDVAMGFDLSQSAPGVSLASSQTGLRSFLPEIVNYISSVSGLCCVDPNPVKTKLAFQVADDNGAVVYDTNFEEYREDVLKKVMSWNLQKTTKFNVPLLKSFDQMFKAQSKADVKVLLIFSDGLDEDEMKLERQSELLQKSGVNALLVVALDGARDAARLQMVEFGRGFGYKVPLSIGMQSIGSTVLKQIESASERECCGVMCKCSGHEGVRGFRGTPGTKGPTGQKGYPGYPGEEGVAGERGRPGPNGPQGLQGCSGLRGAKGTRGLRGNKGEDGELGLDGINGEQGGVGKDGGRGERGHAGEPGIPGIRGEAGLKGQRGLRGDPGESGADNTRPGAKGEVGNSGFPGTPGQDGRPGEGGIEGNRGQDGRRGALGEKGAPGRPGDAGVPGAPGASGPQGPRVAGGQRGPKGIQGLPGPQGGPGAAGGRGLAGRRGPGGQKGQPGDAGDKGAPGSLGPLGMPGQDGRDGQGPQGPSGAKGDSGFPGYPGLTGENGLQGTKGYPGRKGNPGRGGNSGRPGEQGVPGVPGYTGHTGSRGPPGGKGMTECQLITYIRDNCVCSIDRSECPAYPTELVFGLDMSGDVTSAAFERQRSALLALLEDTSIAESNCPSGARVAVVAYSAHTKYLIRFQDYRRKSQLLDAVRNVALERTTSSRQLAGAMRFVAHHVFKRVRSGMAMRKVAVFLSNGPSQDAAELVTAVMEYRALDIVPAVVSLRNAPVVARALELDDSGRSIFSLLGRDMAADLRKVKSCAICYDPCKRSEECAFIQEPQRPQEVDVDLAVVLDGSREVQADQYAGTQQLVGDILEQLLVSAQPTDGQARVAVVQGAGVEFGLQRYRDGQAMARHLTQDIKQPGGASALGQTLEVALQEVLLKAKQPRKKRVVLAVVSTETADRAKLRQVSQKAKCQGVAVFVVALGRGCSRAQAEELASAPAQQHLVHVDQLRDQERGYIRRFFRVFLSALRKGTNSYPPASLKQTCDQLSGGQTSVDGQGQVHLTDDTFQEQARGRLDVTQGLSAGVNDFLSRPQLVGSASKDACFLPQDVGGCQNYTMMWFFDTEQSECSRFWFGGCQGNGNRFNTQADCEDLCLSKSI